MPSHIQNLLLLAQRVRLLGLGIALPLFHLAALFAKSKLPGILSSAILSTLLQNGSSSDRAFHSCFDFAPTCM